MFGQSLKIQGKAHLQEPRGEIEEAERLKVHEKMQSDARIQ
jgi:hypothetical protein